jgi:hypothetical protein
MSLLREIQAAAIDENSSLTTLLLKCQLLAARIDHDELAKWVDLELNGYPPEAPLPEYRVQGHGRAVGTFSGYLGSGMDNVTLQEGSIKEKHRNTLFNIDLRQPVAALDDFAVEREGGQLAIPWPGDYIAHYGAVDTFVSGMALIGANTIVPKAAVISTLSAIRSRVLRVAVKIERANPDAGEGLAGEDPLPRDVRAAVTHNIYGGSVAIGTGRPFALSGPIGQLVAGDVTNVTLANVLARLERDVDAADAPEEEKSKIRQWLAAARETLTDTGSSVAAKTLAELVARGLGGGA